MIRFKVVWFALLAAGAASQPCHEDNTCFAGHFCDTLSGYTCRPCLSCKDLKREEPPMSSPCVKSFRECGHCLKDLVDARSGELSCVSRAEGAAPERDNSAWLWIGAGAVIVVFVVVVAAVVIRYMFRNTSFFKLRLDTNIDARLPTHVPTAPEFPPPPYSPTPATDLLRTEEETERPLIKQYQPPFPAFESQDHQNVSMYNPPAYVRLGNMSVPHGQPEAYNDVNDNYSPPISEVHDDDTTPSAWGPGTNYTVTTSGPAVNGVSASPQPQDGGAPSELSTALATARHTDLIQPPQVTLRLQPVYSGEEAGGDEAHAHGAGGAGGGAARAPPAGSGNYNVMNVNQMITIIQPPLKKQRSF